MKKNIITGIGIGVAVMIYDYLIKSEIDWVRAFLIAIIAMVILFILDRFKK